MALKGIPAVNHATLKRAPHITQGIKKENLNINMIVKKKEETKPENMYGIISNNTHALIVARLIPSF